MYDEKTIDDDLSRLKRKGLFRSLSTLPAVGGKFELNGREILNFASNDYLDLAKDARLKEAGQQAIADYGSGATSSRLIAGHLPVHAELEDRLAAFMGTQAALAYPTGYQCNVGILSTLAGQQDTVSSDALNHASIVDGCRLSGAHVAVYRHNSIEHLEDLLNAVTSPGKKIIVSDSVFSMDGDLAPVVHLAELAKQHHALLIIDEAHAIGVMGEGRGLCRERGVTPDVILGTLSKALGSAGGFAATSHALRSLLINRSRSFIFSTGMAPASAASAIAAVHILDTAPDVGKELLVRAARFRALLRDKGFDVPEDRTQVIPILIGDNLIAVEVADHLREQGILVAAVRPPSVPVGTARLRLSVTMAHMEGDFHRAADALAQAALAAGVLRPSKKTNDGV